jgi:rhodanese-related sulfurtransferase
MGWLSGVRGHASSGTADLGVDDAWRRHEHGALLIDVREPDEWRAGHAPGAQHIPLGSLARRLPELPRDRDVLLVCRSGNRSGSARGLLARNGFPRAFNVAGGMLAWARAGLPITSPSQ